ncbi:hypothetical protein LOK49_Contig23G00004 [Camellia lanceoleosa]|nr:hypothetical protein LOK49_Contig23G00004 [Camellia lanceoleosa]
MNLDRTKKKRKRKKRKKIWTEQKMNLSLHAITSLPMLLKLLSITMLENSTVNIAKSIQQRGIPSVGSVAPSLIEIFLYANGNTQPPIAINLDKSLLRDLLFNQSPAKDVALASVSMRAIPFAPVLEKLSLYEMKYGSVRLFYIETPKDNAISITVQESIINKSPPK